MLVGTSGLKYAKTLRYVDKGIRLHSKNEKIKVTVQSIIQATPKIKFFKLSYGQQDFTFRPGQWIDLYVPIEGKNVGGYTIISATHEKGYIELAIRESQNHPVTKYLHSELKVGDVLEISKAQGNFFLSDEVLASPITFIAGGIGITPILSMLRSIDKNITPVKLFYSVTAPDDILLKDELATHTIFTVTQANSSNWNGEKNRITYELLQKYKANFYSHFFICGPRSMIDSITNELAINGVPKSKNHFEKWW